MRRVNGDTNATSPFDVCEACDCHGHAATCDADTGACGPCLHDTVGERCQLCAAGFYGDASSGRADACRRCRCPLEPASNNFSPTCLAAMSVDASDDVRVDHYVCDQCPLGYEGEHCQRCAAGFYGEPDRLGGSCRPCDCSGNEEADVADFCDRRTGHCLRCRGHTAGPKCDVCRPAFYGDALKGTCKRRFFFLYFFSFSLLFSRCTFTHRTPRGSQLVGRDPNLGVV